MPMDTKHIDDRQRFLSFVRVVEVWLYVKLPSELSGMPNSFADQIRQQNIEIHVYLTWVSL